MLFLCSGSSLHMECISFWDTQCGVNVYIASEDSFCNVLYAVCHVSVNRVVPRSNAYVCDCNVFCAIYVYITSCSSLLY